MQLNYYKIIIPTISFKQHVALNIKKKAGSVYLLGSIITELPDINDTQVNDRSVQLYRFQYILAIVADLNLFCSYCKSLPSVDMFFEASN